MQIKGLRRNDDATSAMSWYLKATESNITTWGSFSLQHTTALTIFSIGIKKVYPFAFVAFFAVMVSVNKGMKKWDRMVTVR